jgi:hypothetical protein
VSVFFFRCACRQVHWQCLTVEDLQSMADYNVLQRDPYTGAGKKNAFLCETPSFFHTEKRHRFTKTGSGQVWENSTQK